MTAEKQESLPSVDYIEVGREAHQLSLSHGQNAYLYAIRLAQSAQQNGKFFASQFWHAVYEAIRPR